MALASIKTSLKAALAAATWLPIIACAAPMQDAPLLRVDEAFVLEPVTADAAGTHIPFHIAPGYYLYRHRLMAQTADGRTLPLDLPDGAVYIDPQFGRVEIYRGELDAGLATDRAASTLVIQYQGCADAGVCYPTQTRTVPVERRP